MRKHVFFILVIILAPLIIKSQVLNNDKVEYNLVQVPPSPDAASLGKFVENPVSLNTGIPQITVPVLNLNLGTISIPVTMNYHASGIKVEEEASWVGLGWALNVGGAISRTVRARPDEHHGFLYTGNQLPVENYIELDIITLGRLNNAMRFLSDVHNNRKDYEPDAFFYSFPSGSGSFMFNNHAEPATIPFSDVKIEFSQIAGDITSFTVTDANGLIYYYGDTVEIHQNQYVEITKTSNGAFGSIEDYVSTWHLNKIVNPFTAQVVKFYYSSGNIRTISRVESELWEQDCLFCQRISKVRDDESTTLITTSVKYLSKIEYDNTSIELYTSTRRDNWGRKLDSIKFNNEVIKYCYTYYNSNGDTDELRLKLDALVFSDGSRNQTYSFNYDNGELPSKKSKKQDHWGYYNDNPINSLIPSTYYGVQLFSGGNREPNFQKASTGILNEIIYPTGGSTRFYYELNTALRNPTVSEVSINDQIDFALTDSTSLGPPIIQRTFDIVIIDTCQLYDFKMVGSIIDESQTGVLHPKHLANAAIIDSTGNVIYSESIDSLSCCFSIDIEPTIINNCRLRLTLNRCDSSTFNVSIVYSKYDSSQLVVMKEYDAGGLRIKRIINHDINGETIKSYDYCQSGYLTRIQPQYYSAFTYFLPQNNNPASYDQLKRVYKYASPVGGLGSSSNSVAYTKVKEIEGTPEKNNGYKITYFRQIVDDVSGGAYDAQCSMQYLREKVIKEEQYNTKNIKIQERRYEYMMEPNHNEVIEGFKVSKNYELDPALSAVGLYENLYNFYRYNYAMPLEMIKEITNIDYFKKDSLKTLTEYEYGSKHLNPKVIKTLNSKGQTVSKEYKYAPDYIDIFNNSCITSYINDLVTCSTIFPECFDEAIECNEIYGACFDLKMDRLRIYNQLVAPLLIIYDSLAKDNKKILERLIIEKKISHINNIYEDIDIDIDECLRENSFNECVGKLYCGYIPCSIEADKNYLNCQDSLKNQFGDLYTNETDEHLRAIYALIMYDCNNKVIEEKTYNDGKLIEHLEYVYSMYKLYDTYEIPILYQVIKRIDDSHEIVIQCDSTDQFSNILQTDQKQLKTVFDYGYNNSLVVSKTINSSIQESGFINFENKELNGWSFNIDNVSDDYSFTGEKSIKLSSQYGPGQEFFVGNQALNHSGYQASVWVRGSKGAYLHIEANGYSIHETITNDSDCDSCWNLLKVKLEKSRYQSVIDSNLKIKVYVGNTDGNAAFFDDLRFYPLDAQMTTYTYMPLIGVTSESDNNNRPIRYEYDGFGRLVLIKDFENNVIKKYEYNYKQ